MKKIVKKNAKICTNIEILKHLDVFFFDHKKINKRNTLSPKTKNWLTIIFLVVNIVVLALVLNVQLNKEGGVYSFSELLKNIDLKFIGIAALCFIAVVTCETFKVSLFTKVSTGKARLQISYRGYAMAKYYELITPMAMGGQPFHVYYMSMNQIPVGKSISIVGARYVSNRIVFSTIALLTMIFCNANIIMQTLTNSPEVTFSKSMAWIGFGAIMLTFMAIFLVSTNRKVVHKIGFWITNIFYKLKIVKKPGQFYIKIMRPFLSCNKSMKEFFSSPKATFGGIGLSILYYSFHYTIPFMIYCAFNGFSFEIWLPMISMCILIDLAIAASPIPGGTGVAEISFTALFSMMFTGGMTFWALIIWRIFTYYAYILQGALLMVFTSVKSIERNALKIKGKV